jgi:hypothetical protein
MENILHKQQNYDTQISKIRQHVFQFAKEKNWKTIYRGRHAHASIEGQIKNFSGVIDIQMWLDDWEYNPPILSSNYPFELWAGGYTRESEKFFESCNDLYKMLPFETIEKEIKSLLEEAWNFLNSLDIKSFIYLNNTVRYKKAILRTINSLIKSEEFTKADREYKKYLVQYPEDRYSYMEIETLLMQKLNAANSGCNNKHMPGAS